MINNLFDKSVNLPGVVFSTEVNVLTPVQVAEKSGLVRFQSEFRVNDITLALNEFKSSDFSISSLESIGALGTLKLTYMSSMHDMNVADQFENLSFDVETK